MLNSVLGAECKTESIHARARQSTESTGFGSSTTSVIRWAVSGVCFADTASATLAQASYAA